MTSSRSSAGLSWRSVLDTVRSHQSPRQDPSSGSAAPLTESSVAGLHGPRHIEKSLWIAYLAGYLDGEGSFTVWHGTTPAISVSNTFPYVLEALRKEWGGSISLKSRKDGAKARTAWEWRVWGDRAIDVARMVSPYLVEKRVQADLMAQVRTWPPGSQQRKDLVERLKALKRIDYGKDHG